MYSPLLAPRLRLGDMLVERGYLTTEQLGEALERQRATGRRKLLGEIAVEMQLCTDEQVLECLAVECGVPFVRLDARLFDPAALELLPREFIERNNVLPLFRVRDELTVAVTEPSNVFLLDAIRDQCEQSEATAGCTILPVLTSLKDVRRAIATYLPDKQVFVLDDLIDDAADASVEVIEEELEELSFDFEGSDQSPIIKLVNYLICQAARDGASDIHIEPTERLLRVRYRVDGVLRPGPEPPAHLAAAVASRIKVMAGLDISERRLPQDGRINVMLEGRSLDLRVSTLPMPQGEKVVMRLLDSSAVSTKLDELGFSADLLEAFREQIVRPNGIALVTGPTGSGKSTTLYSVLQELASPENNVCTVEDPIEAQLSLVNQFMVNEKIGLTFATVLRSLLRQDPDICMVGEIRDKETAGIAIQAALTGHLVFSTLHTNDAASTVMRMIHMGVEGYLLAASLNMVLSQRLCRRVCAKCKEAYEPPRPMRMTAEKLGLDFTEYVRGAGCSNCRGTGFSGRIAIHELLTVDDNLRELMTGNPSLGDVRRASAAAGMISLTHDGFRKAREGLTTVEEVVKVAGA